MLDMVRSKRKRDYKTIKAMRKPYCERCGRAASIEPHHVFTVGSGGKDISVKELTPTKCTAETVGRWGGMYDTL